MKKIDARFSRITLGILLTLMIWKWVFGELPLYAGLACLISTKDGLYLTLKTGRDRILGTILGGIIGLILVHSSNVLGLSLKSLSYIVFWVFSIGAAIIIASFIGASEYVITMTCVILLIIMVNGAGAINQVTHYVLFRSIETAFGVIIAIVITLFDLKLFKSGTL